MGFTTHLFKCKYCEEKISPYLIIQIDADGQHDPNKIPEFIKKIEQGADFVVGTRYSGGGSIPENWGLHRKILSKLKTCRKES